jgi:polysaccharide biosynthesis/export protein
LRVGVRGLVALLALGACAPRSQPVVHAKALPSPVVARTEEVLDPGVIDSLVGQQDGEPYQIGPGDTLLVAVYNHPELAIATYAGVNGGAAASPSGRSAGLYVDNDGTIQLPLIGPVQVAGQSTNQLRQLLERELARYVKSPRVTVQVLFNGSIRYVLLGQFVSPGLKTAERPMRLLEAISLGGSIILDRASLGGAYVIRDNRRLPVNFRRLLREGDMRQNIRLRSADIVFVPDAASEQAFVFGGAAGSNAKGGPVTFPNGRLDLVQALAQAGFGFRERAQGDLSQVRIIRSEGDRGQFFVVNVNAILNGDAGSFPLAPGDVVFVPETGVTTWNEAIQQILPTLQTISGLLNPFVQIKFLSQ